MRGLRTGIAAAGIAAVAGVGAWLGWLAIAGEFARSVDTWAAARRAEGLEVAYGTPALGGFPLRWQAALPGPRLAGASAEGALAWRGPELTLVWRAWDPRRLAFRAPGAHRIEWPGGGAALGAEAADADLWDTDGIGNLRARLGKLDFEAAGVGVTLAARSVQLLASQSLDALGVRAEAEGVVVAKGLDSPLGTDISRVALDLLATGRIEARGSLRARLENFRAGGGSVEIRRLELDWGPLRLAATGTLELDAELRPRGLLTARVRGLAEAIALYEAAGLLPRNRATAIRLAATLVTRPNGDGEPEAELPLILEGGAVSLGPVVLARLLPLAR